MPSLTTHRPPEPAHAAAPFQPERRGALGRPSRGRGDTFEWHEGEKSPPAPKYDSHRVEHGEYDDDRRLGYRACEPR